jgi:hypothetical protein
MITLKSLSRKLEKLEASMQKDARRLSKLIRKVKRAASKTSPNKALIRGKAEQTAASVPSGRQRRKLSVETRAKLSARMHERWAAKRAADVPLVAAEPVTISTTNGDPGNGG